jgi:hypothetical protein
MAKSGNGDSAVATPAAPVAAESGKKAVVGVDVFARVHERIRKANGTKQDVMTELGITEATFNNKKQTLKEAGIHLPSFPRPARQPKFDVNELAKELGLEIKAASPAQG